MKIDTQTDRNEKQTGRQTNGTDNHTKPTDRQTYMYRQINT